MCDCKKKVTVIEECVQKQKTSNAMPLGTAGGAVLGGLIGGPIGIIVGGCLGCAIDFPTESEKQKLREEKKKS